MNMRFSLAVLLLATSLGGCSCSTVDPGNVGVVVVLGEVKDTNPYREGFHLVGPTTDLHEMSIRLQTLDADDVPCRSHDNVAIRADVTVQYSLRAPAAPKVYRQLGDEYANTVLLPAIRSSVRDAVASVEAMVAAQSRESLETTIENSVRTSLRQTLQRQRLPENAIVLDGVQLRNMDLPQSLTDSIESIQRQRNAAMERQMAIETAQQEADRLRIEMEGQNRVALLEAQRQADVRRIAGESEAAYNRVVSQSLTPALVELRRIEAARAVVNNPNAHLVILGGGGSNGGTPIVLNPTLP